MLHALALRDQLRAVGTDDPAALAEAFYAATAERVEPWYRATLTTDRHRLGEVEAGQGRGLRLAGPGVPAGKGAGQRAAAGTGLPAGDPGHRACAAHARGGLRRHRPAGQDPPAWRRMARHAVARPGP